MASKDMIRAKLPSDIDRPRRLTSRSTYGGGRFLYNGIMGADLSAWEKLILLDFNFAYNLSCAYKNRWVCPLAPALKPIKFGCERSGEVVYSWVE